VSDTIFAILSLPKPPPYRRGPQFEKHWSRSLLYQYVLLSTQRYNPEDQHRHPLCQNYMAISSALIIRPNVVVEWLTLLLRILEVPGSYLGPETGYPDCVFRGFLQSLQANAGIVYQNRTLRLPSISFPIRHSLTAFLFHA
jgi:hypothetical protein